MLGRQHQSSLAAHRVTDHEGAFGVRGVEDRDRIGGVLRLGVCLRLFRPVREAVPARVEGDHAEMPREYGTCIFHACEWTIAQVGSSSTVVAPVPKTS